MSSDTAAEKNVRAEDDEPIELPSDPVVILLSILVILASLTAAYFAAEIILPIVVALILKLLLEPTMRFLRKLGIPRGLGALFLILVVFGLIVGIGAGISGPASEWAAKLPDGIPRLQERLKFLNQPIEVLQKFLHQVDNVVGGGGGSNAANSAEHPSVTSGLAATLFLGTTHFASRFFETILILFFMLMSGGIFLKRGVEIVPRFKDKRRLVEISLDVERHISGYLVTITLMNAAVGIATGIATWATGLGDPVLWGVLAFLLNYVPIMGPVFGIGIFLLAGLLAIDTLWIALLPAGLYLLIHVIEGEIVTPMLLARRFTLNPVLVIIALVFWFWMWGIPGAILSVPMLAIAKIICDEVSALAAVGHFLGGDEQ
ncbi:AI-2E family transporter [Ancylobacter sp. 6x-1]|uniref:AI-2E family transporter n=1 Tax=Ancylobacter crimeensis TaxID=2579147 RepID=A0ABT0D9W8_9HYPH|nr:AI-2E family transporter [Ancylobacter crimeensis]MCK0196747.1 AI-2E family transporter [Ancylobacter crimeensis]